VLCTGDVADGSGSVGRCCELLRQRDVQTVRGNHDRWFLTGVMRDLPEATDASAVPAEAWEYLATLATTRVFSSALGGVLLWHGLGLNDMAKIGPDDFGYALEANEDLQSLQRNPAYRFVVDGHTHHAMVRHLTRLTVINAGTLRSHDNPGFLLVGFENWLLHVRFARYTCK
jgi:predicted phosphodiesterase